MTEQLRIAMSVVARNHEKLSEALGWYDIPSGTPPDWPAARIAISAMLDALLYITEQDPSWSEYQDRD